MSRTLKPLLIKFSCPACGTRLAVPLSMAGVEDHCPKCSAIVAAPLPKEPTPSAVPPKPSPVKTKKQDQPGFDVLLASGSVTPDPPSTATSSPPPAETIPASEESSSGLPASLMDEFLSTPASSETAAEQVLPMVEETAPRPQRKSRARLPRQEAPPIPPPPSDPSPETSDLSQDSPLARDPGPIFDTLPDDQTPDHHWNDLPPENLADIGMGDALASYLSAPTLPPGRQNAPVLGVSLLQVSGMPTYDRRAQGRRRMAIGLVIFLLIDAMIALWFFRNRIPKGRSSGEPVNVIPANTSSANQPDPDPSKKIEDSTATPPVIPPTPANTPEQNNSNNNSDPGNTITGPDKVFVPPSPVVEPTPPKLPDEKTTPPPVIAKIEIEPPPPPPPAPIVLDSTPPAETAIPTPLPSIETVDGVPEKSALESLKAFLAATSISERLRWIQKPDVVRPLMEKHYTSHADGPVKVGRIDFISSHPSKDGVPPYSMFELSGGSLKKSVLALVEESSKNEHRVDWEAFVEFKDGLLWEFTSKPGSLAQKFRIIMRRTHYFDKDVPDVGNKDGFELSQPGSDAVAHVFVPRNSPVARQLAQPLGWDSKIPATLELVWRADGNRHWVEIQSVPSFGWRG